ncbi:hypothetical protein LPB138_08865 [Urechidicola croceus]|uniref:Uncharacterized protein n=2 Tax=Urechidicola croceus TaxID=1850246 RepID=A0A1D8PBZ2_9FLAO|nr:hypothetical protein LPB138_08865 [Urechidicola croceus]
MRLKKMKAGALQYTLFVSVLIALLVTAFISLSFLQQKLRIKATFFQETIHNTNLGIDYSSTHEIPYNETIELQFNDEIESLTTISKKRWGLFDIITSTSQVKNETFEKMALVGGHQDKRNALYLSDNRKPLVLVGHTEIRGNTLLPKQGPRRGNIAGNSYYGSQLIYGNIGISGSTLPQIEVKNYVKKLTTGAFLNNNTEFFELDENLKKVNSFNKPTQVFNSMGAIDLQFVELTGNIIIKSNSRIKVHPSAKLNDIILIAPKIEIANGVTGTIQAFATKEIIVGKQCNLQYPSAFVLNEKVITQRQSTDNQQQSTNQLSIDSSSSIKGIVCFLSENDTKNFKPQIILQPNATIVGEVYCEKNFELSGTVKGMVYTDSFIAPQFGSVYINHIFNGKIIEPDISEQYCGLQFNNTQNKVVKWLY